jgi:hypothetical protein
MKTPLNRLPATQLARMIAAREVSSEAVTHSYVDAIRQSEKDIRAFAWFDAGRALATARELDRVGWRGALHGRWLRSKKHRYRHPQRIPAIIGHVPPADAACRGTARGAFVLSRRSPRSWRTSPRPDAQSARSRATPGGSSSGRRRGGGHGTVRARQTAIRSVHRSGVVGFVPTRGSYRAPAPRCPTRSTSSVRSPAMSTMSRW